jgi:hypothetical protein
MARGKDLAGLAALGALGMMMSKGKKGSDTSGMDTEGFEGIKDLPRRDTGMSEKEPGWESGTSTKPSASKPTASRTRATAPSSRSTISVDDEAGMSRGTRPRDPRNAEAGMSRGTRTTSMAGAGRGVTMPTQPQADSTTEAGMRNYVPRRTPQANSTTEAGMQNYVSRAPTGMERDTAQADRVRNLAGAFNVPMSGRAESPVRQRLSEDGVPYKKGGKVTSKVSSASSRADGIATKGKTRGRYL